MATQLIVYPQSFDGVLSLISRNNNEYIVDGLNFLSVDASSSYQAATTPLIFLGQYPTIQNTWFRGRINAGADYPVATSNNLVFDSTAAFSTSLIYQRIGNLIAGQHYTLFVNVSSFTGTGGVFNIKIYSSTGGFPFTQIGSTTSGAATGLFSAGFFCPNNLDVFISIEYYITSASTMTVSYVSLLPSTETPNISTSDGQVICDLYEDEDIPLTLSVDNFKNAAEQVQSYSKAFNLPATKRNNKIFDNLFEITRSSLNNATFNPYAKTRCALKQDGFILFEGYLRVLDIQDKDGEISYNVNLYSEVIALADLLGDRPFSELDFTELDHAYQYTNIKNSWNDSGTGIAYTNPSTSGYRNAFSTLKYPFCDWNHSYTVGATNEPVLPNLESSFRPFINIKYLIQKIFAATEIFSYSSDFIDNDSDFGKLYMDFNWGEARTPLIFNDLATLGLNSDYNLTGSFTTINFIPYVFPATIVALPSGFGYSSGVFTAPANNQTYNVTYDLTFQAAGVFVYEVEWLHTFTGGTQSINPHTGSGVSFGTSTDSYQGSFSVVMQSGDTLICRAKETTGAVKVLDSSSGFGSGTLIGPLIQVSTNANETTTDSLLQTLRGELGQWEFLKGIMTMFNLVSMPDTSNPNNILIEPYKDIFLPNLDPLVKNFFENNSTQLDWTSKIDISQIKLTPLTELNKTTSFKFIEDDDDYVFSIYKKNVQGHLYGSLLFDATTTTGGLQSVLSGEEEISAEPFAATVPKALMSQFADFITPAIYSYDSDDGTSEGFENAPRIMFNNGVKSAALGTFNSATYKVPEQNGVAAVAAENAFLQFSHLTDIPTVISSPSVASDTQDFHFGACQLVGSIGSATPNNLFGIYWLPYFSELYNPDTRIMSLKVNLTPGDVNAFKFYNTVFIKNREFRVNKIDYKPNDLATVEFILIP